MTQTKPDTIKEYFKSNYMWLALILLFGLSVFGVGIDYDMEWKITWFVIIVVGWVISRDLK